MDKTIEELVKSCKPFFSKRTQYLHFDGPYEKKHDTIPILENFCYALALMRLKEKESFLEAKDLIEKLLEFQVDGNFPRYLHDYPRCYHNWQSIDLLPIFNTIETHFLSYFNEEAKQKFLKSKTALQKHAESVSIFKLDQFDELLRQNQLELLSDKWMPFRLLLDQASQEGLHPKESLLDHTLSYLHDLPPKKLSPEFLKLVLVLPKHLEFKSTDPEPTLAGNTLFWKYDNQIHTLALFAKGGVKSSQNGDKITFVIDLPEGEVQDVKEIYFYLNRNAHPKFTSKAKQVSAFQLDSPLIIEACGLTLQMSFTQDSSAQFYGHIALGNRDNQLLHDQEAYDNTLGIRTVRRNGPSKLTIELKQI